MFRSILPESGCGPARSRFSRSLVALVTTASLCVLLLAIPTASGQAPVTRSTAIPAQSKIARPKGIPSPAPNSIIGRGDKQEILDLEPAVAQAELILAVRLVDVTETKIVQGGRNVQITEQYRFELVRVLKGIFARESLLLTGQDLGIYRFAESSDRLTRGQLMLVLLGRQGQNYFNCNGADARPIDPEVGQQGRPAADNRRAADQHDAQARPS